LDDPDAGILEARGMKKLLWVGDGDCPTGFGRVSHSILEQLYTRWEVQHLAINYRGDPHDHPWKLLPAARGGVNGEDLLGFARFAPVIDRFQPDVVCILGDPWVVPAYLRQLEGRPGPSPKLAAYIPVDGENVRAELLNRLDHVMTYTEFGLVQLRLGGYQGHATIVPHGVDSDFFHPIDRKEARVELGLPPTYWDAFIVGNVNRNQTRKRMDLTMHGWAEWWRRAGRPEDAYLLLHCVLQDPAGWNLQQLGQHLGISSRIIFTGQGTFADEPSSDERLRLIYNSLDGGITTTRGEGWGLTTMEMMACNIRQAVPNFAALGEWAAPPSFMMRADDIYTHTEGLNVVSRVPTIESIVEAIDWLKRATYAYSPRDLVTQDKYRWDTIGEQVHECLNSL
jgi:glycosyltransferase involved in cell wall biosynthesis